ncbi:hypothetical protein DRH29_04285 [candidate division Kazan bacterium]|uniref:Cohesin domain-containing protein n=1 Tax=candidate division Kazan bacterium TaxID=2202143 RepID=A0A420ZBP6_UNCK3|nr:MAG: hypothetical protein DRH29_04285 [candidate division Kazan bacterium]
MKKIQTTVIFVAALFLLVPFVVNAASVVMSPTEISIEPEETFAITLTANPGVSTVYTTGVNISFDADVVEVTGFSFSSNWVEVKQSGYDVVDNESGVLVKTAGYPGGFSSPKVFGVVTLRSKSEGDAEFNLTNESLMLDETSSDIYVAASEGRSASIYVSPVEEPQTEDTVVEEPVYEENAADKETIQEVPEFATTTAPEQTTTTEEMDTEPQPQSTFIAAVFKIITFGTGNNWVGLGFLIVIATVTYILVRKARKTKKKLTQ